MTDVLTLQQMQIAQMANTTLRLLDRVVPTNVAHWAVEDARNALKALVRESRGIRTHDFDGVWRDGDVVISPRDDHGSGVTYVRQDGEWRAFGPTAIPSFRAQDADVDRWLGGSLTPIEYRALVRAGKPVA